MRYVAFVKDGSCLGWAPHARFEQDGRDAVPYAFEYAVEFDAPEISSTLNTLLLARAAVMKSLKGRTERPASAQSVADEPTPLNEVLIRGAEATRWIGGADFSAASEPTEPAVASSDYSGGGGDFGGSGASGDYGGSSDCGGSDCGGGSD